MLKKHDSWVIQNREKQGFTDVLFNSCSQKLPKNQTKTPTIGNFPVY